METRENKRAAGQAAYGNMQDVGEERTSKYRGYTIYETEGGQFAVEDPNSSSHEMLSIHGDMYGAKQAIDRLKKQMKNQGTAIDQLREGVAVEKEHADMITWLKQYVAAHDGEFPPDTEIQARIAQKHLEEDPEYYKKLATIENKNDSKLRIDQDRLKAGKEFYGSHK